MAVQKFHMCQAPGCSIVFLGGNTAKWCPECRKKQKQQCDKDRRKQDALERDAMKKKPVPKPVLSLTEMAVLARKAGMTYGELSVLQQREPKEFERIRRKYENTCSV